MMTVALSVTRVLLCLLPSPPILCAMNANVRAGVFQAIYWSPSTTPSWLGKGWVMDMAACNASLVMGVPASVTYLSRKSSSSIGSHAVTMKAEASHCYQYFCYFHIVFIYRLILLHIVPIRELGRCIPAWILLKDSIGDVDFVLRNGPVAFGFACRRFL